MFTLQSGKQHAIASTGPISHCLNAGGMGRIDYETETLISVAGTLKSNGDGGGLGSDPSETFVPVVTHSLRADGFDASEDGTGRGTPLVPVAFNLRGRDGGSQPEVSDVASIRAASGGSSRSYVAASAVRRLTPLECERLQGFPDGYTAVPRNGKIQADGPRYKQLGNSMAVPCMAWLGQRIQMMDEL